MGRRERILRAAGYSRVAGVDEAGRGSLFGPVFAAAVVLSPDKPVRGLRDSKVLDAARREELAPIIRARAVCWGVGAADVFEIDRINIYQASLLAMKRAIAQLQPPCDCLILDAVRIPDLDIHQEPLIGADAKCQAVAAASILAKTERDRCLAKWDEVFPEYGLAHHKGYFTEEHQEALRKYGPTMLHRFSFEPVRACAQYSLWTGYDLVEPAHASEPKSGSAAHA
jgi:ribonuclease HII